MCNTLSCFSLTASHLDASAGGQACTVDVQCGDELLRNYIAYSFLSLNMNNSFFEIQWKDSEWRALSLSCIIL